MVSTSGGTEKEGGSSGLDAESCGGVEETCGAMLRGEGVGASGSI